MTRLLQKEIFEELTMEDREELEDWLKTDATRREWYDRMRSRDFMKEDHRHYLEIADPEQAWGRMEGDMNRNVRKTRWTWIGSVAAVAVIIFCVTFFWGREGKIRPPVYLSVNVHESVLISLIVDDGKDSIPLNVNQDVCFVENGVRAENNTLIYDTVLRQMSEVEHHTLAVGRGGEYRLTLSDGSVVWFNAGSSLRYPVCFTGDRRVVELHGEAFFQVSPNEKMPFEVKSGDFSVSVLGTSFNVTNYMDEQYARVTLATGKLQVNKGEHCVIIHPNQQVQLGSDCFDVREVDARYYTSWIENKFMFDDEPLNVIVRKLARWYDLDYEFTDPSLEGTRFSGQLLKYDDITKAFELLEMTTNVHFTINQNTILIMKGKQ